MVEEGQGAERLKEAVPRIVTELFEKDRRVVLLSSVGQRLRREGIDFKGILGDIGLATFIRQNLSGQVELKSAPENPKIVAAYPSSVDLTQELDPSPAVSRRAAPSSDHQPSSNRLFMRDVWYAFSHTLEQGKARYLMLSPAPTYRDIPDGEPFEGGLEVSAENIVPVGTAPAYERNRRIIGNIEAWAEKNGVSLDEISERARARAARSALDVLLHSLSQGELTRISLPLDIIRTLRTKRVD